MLGIGVRHPEDATLLGGQTIHVILKVNPLRLLMTKPSSLNRRLAKWHVLILEGVQFISTWLAGSHTPL